MNLDALIIPLDHALRTLFAPASSVRPIPGAHLDEPELSGPERAESAALMRVNHTGEVCAQALYEGQMLVARDLHVRELLQRAAREETEHLAWTEGRLNELGARTSVLNPLFYAGSFALGAGAGLLGDRWSLGFLVETERQVEQHLEGHLERLPAPDAKSRAIVEQMRADESGHALAAQREGGAELPLPVRTAMRLASRVMTGTTRWV
jgi:ubiquinone biosynthesis monooxygenase Coq7